jgi:acid stress-induced BolA-like protein IbaG/YrbA
MAPGGWIINQSIDQMMQPEDIKQMIETGLPGARVSVTGDGHHFEAEVVAREFTGKGMLQRHQIVYRTLGGKMGNEIHALSLRTLAPEE